MREIWDYLVDKKIWVYRAAALTCLPAYYFTKDMTFVVLLWIQVVGMEVMITDCKRENLKKEIKEKNEIIKWEDECRQEDAHNFKVVRDKQREDIKKLKEEITRLNQENATYSKDYKTHARIIEEQTERIKKLYAELNAMIVTGDGSGKSLPPIAEPLVMQTHEGEPKLRVKRVIKESQASAPIEPERVPEPEPMQAVIEETEPQPTPVFNDTAVMETTTEEVTTVVKTKKTKAPSATVFTDEQTTRYMQMIQDKEPRKVILTAMMGEAGINEGAANNRYYALKEKMQKQKITDSIQTYNNNAVTVIKMEPNAKPLPRSIQAELDAMPVYDTIKDFKNAVCENELLKGYSIAELKEPYRSHRLDMVKW